MDDGRFDALTRSLGQAGSRRSALKAVLGMVGAATIGTVSNHQAADAARRPTPTPKPVTCAPPKVLEGGVCVCPGGSTACGPDCCPDGQAECCDNACCYGDCYGEEMCCPTGNAFCTVDGCCDGGCVNNGETCCPAHRLCRGYACCPEDMRCCEPDGRVFFCIAADECCHDSDCPSGTRCVNYQCE